MTGPGIVEERVLAEHPTSRETGVSRVESSEGGA
jgi:hypothetical protein